MECVVKCVIFLSLLLSVQAVTTASMPLSSAPNNETNSTDTGIHVRSTIKGHVTPLFCKNDDGNMIWEKDTDEGRELILTAKDGEITKKHKSDPNKRYTVLFGALIIMRTFLVDSGIYYCNGVPVVNLTVASLTPPPVMLDRSAIEGGVTLLFCKSDGNIQWGKYTDGGTELILTVRDGEITHKHKPDPENRFKILPSTLIISRTFPSDSGIYYCNSDPIVNLTVVSPASLGIPVFTAIQGDVTPLLCKDDDDMIWKKGTDGGRKDILTANGGEITKKHKFDPENRFKILPGILIISRTFLSDSGIYYCNGDPAVNLTVVSSAPLAGISDRSGIEGGVTPLFCTSDDEMIWEKDTDEGRNVILTANGGEITKKHKYDPENRFKILAGTLIIMRTFLSDSGIYYCNGDPVVNLTVVSPASPAGISDRNAIEGGVTLLFCKSDGNMIWEKDTDEGRELILTAKDGEITKKHIPDPDDRYEVLAGTLMIMKTFLSDSGVYYCNDDPVVNLTVVSPANPAVNSTTEKTRGSISVSSPSDTESSPANTGGVSEVEVGLMFGGVGLVALVFLLATVAAVQVIRQKASLEDTDYINCSD